MPAIMLRRAKKPTILNSQGKNVGKPVKLNAWERANAAYWEKEVNSRFHVALKNSLGYEIQITTLTEISKEISEQKFFEISPADYMPVKVGQGMWSTNITTYRSYSQASLFENGIINLGGQNARLATADAGIDALNILVYPWAYETGWTIFELEEASRSGNWDLISAKERARKECWDLGVQRIAFLGAVGLNGVNGTCLGFLNQPSIPVNTSVITAPISSLSTTDLKTFCADVVEAFRKSCNRTAWPNRFSIPESDYNGCSSQSSPDFPIKSVLQVLEETFATATRQKDFKILPNAYQDMAYSGYGYQNYVLSKYDQRSGVMNIPLPYTNTVANSINNFQFQTAAYGQFTGYLALRPLEHLYFQYA